MILAKQLSKGECSEWPDPLCIWNKKNHAK